MLADRNAEGLDDTARLIAEAVGDEKVDVLRIPTDVLKAEQIENLIEEAVEHFGRIDYAVNGAGTLISISIFDTDR